MPTRKTQLLQLQKLAAIGQLGAGITHEVRNVMTGILGFAQVAQRKVDDPKPTLELLRMIEQESLRCLDILAGFLEFSRPGPRARTSLDPAELIDGAARLVRHQLSTHHVRLELAARRGVPRVAGNRGELEQVLVNLLINAQHAMPDGGRVRIGAARAPDGFAVIEVADDGPGIPAPLQARIFAPYFTTKPAGQGVGLGLALSEGIVRAHGGTLTVASAPGKGATFTVRLPLAMGESGGMENNQTKPAT